MQNEKCKSPKGRAQIDSLRPKKVPYSLCRDVMARACTESNQRSKGKLEAQFPFKIPPILHTYTCHPTSVIRVQYAIGLQVNLCQKLFFLQKMERTCCVQKLFLTFRTFSPGLSLEFSCIELVIQ